MKKITLVFSLILCSFFAQSQTNYQVGPVRGNSSDNTSITRMEFDSYDYQVLFGKFKDSVKVDAFYQNNTLYGGSSTVHNAFFAVLDESGFPLFAHKLGNSTDSVTITCANIDYSGNLYIGGSFKGTVDFADNAGSPFYLTSTGSDPDAFIATFDYTGNFMNAIVLECDSTRASVNGIVVNGMSEIKVVGNFIGTIDMDGSGSVLNYISTEIDGFIASYDMSLNYLSSVAIDGPGKQIPMHIKTDWTDIIIGGYFEGQIDFDLSGSTNILPSNGGKDAFMMYMDNSYLGYYHIGFGGAGNDKVKDFYFDYSQGFYVLADFEQTVNFDPNFGTTMLTSNGQSDVAVIRYYSNFQLGYVKQFGNSNADIGYRIIQNLGGGARQNRGGPPPPSPEDDFMITMSFSGSLDVDPDGGSVLVTSSNTPVNSAIINLDSAGYYLFHGVNEAKSIVGYKGSGPQGNTMILAGNFAGSNVDMLPYQETSFLSHAGTNSGFYMNYYRCQMIVDEPYIKEPFECGTATVKLGIDVLSGGVEPYDYFWSNGDYISYDHYPTDAYQDNGSYFNVSVSDFYGCGWGDTIWILAHDTSAVFDANLTITHTSCGNDFGSAQAVSANALGTTSYYWSDGETDDTADSLLAGNYFVQVIDDSLKCYVEKVFFIDNTDGPQITVNSSTNANCGSINDGSIDVTVTGGATPYTFNWTNGANTEDISGLSGGTYTLTVTDASGCENRVCVTLTQPQELSAYFNYGNSSCLNPDGSISVTAYGGDAPYTYLWDAAAGNSTNDTVTGLPAGFYSVTVTDSVGCAQTFTYGLGDWNGPGAWVSWNTNPDCLGNNGYIDVYVADWNGTFAITNQWFTGETTEDITVTNGGWYHFIATDGLGCKSYTSAWVYENLPMSPTVCMVTVDSTGTQNVVVWDKSTTPEAEYYNVYREGFCNSDDFGIVGAVAFDSLSVFYDTVVNSDTRTWRYYVTAVDTCGNESEPSEVHRTIHLTAAIDADTNAFLDWSEYQGMQIYGYKIYRRQPTGTLFDYVDSVDAFQTNYLDTMSFAGYTELEYFVDAVPMMVCSATRAYNQNEARSNHSRAGIPAPDTTTLDLPELTETAFALYPNPTNDMVNLNITGSKGLYKMEMMDQTGRVIMSGQLRDRALISTKDIPVGVYFIRMTSETNEIHTLKLMVIR